MPSFQELSQYKPAPVPNDPSQLPAYLTTEFNRLATILNQGGDNQFQQQYVEPSKKSDGMIRLADGTQWNPRGTGKGFVYWSGSDNSWHAFNDAREIKFPDGTVLSAQEILGVVAGQITSTSIQNAAVLASAIANAAITAPAIAASAIGTAALAAGSVIASKIAVATLSSIAANVGTLTAGVIQSTDGKFKIDLTNDIVTVLDASSVTRVKIGEVSSGVYGIQVYNSAGTLLFDDTSGLSSSGLPSNVNTVIDSSGNIQAGAKIGGRSEGIGTTVGFIDSGGVLLGGGADFSRPYAGKTASNFTYGSGVTIESLKPAEIGAAAALKGLQNTVPQPAPDASGVVTGWSASTGIVTAAMYTTNANAPVIGYFQATISGGAIDAWVSRNGTPIDFTATGGDTLYAEAYTDMDTGVSIELAIEVLGAAGGYTSYAFFSNSAASAWKYQSGKITLPADCVSYRLYFYISGTNGNKAYWSNVVVGHQSRGLTTVNSGVRLGNEFNQTLTSISGQRYTLSGFGITSGPNVGNTAQHISVASGTLYAGSASAAINSSTTGNVFTATDNGTYYLYYLIQTPPNGTLTLTLNYTQNLANLSNQDGVVYLGKITLTGNGTGGSGNNSGGTNPP